MLQAQTTTPLHGTVLEVRNLRQLELLLEKAGNSVVVIFFYSKVWHGDALHFWPA